MIRFDFVGRRAVVTGGARGIGRAIADRLVASGASVTLWDLIDPSDSRGPFGRSASDFAFRCTDVTDEKSVAAALQTTLDADPSIDILVNAAGVTGPTKPLEHYTFSEWRRVLDVNLDGVFLCARAIIPAMIEGGYGRIVSIASVAGKQGNPSMAAYSAAKGGVIALTKALGLELAASGVLVNCVTPGLVKTELLKEMSQSAIEVSASKIPLKRLGTVEEIAAQVLWAASEDCSFATGTTFDASGGRSSY